MRTHSRSVASQPLKIHTPHIRASVLILCLTDIPEVYADKYGPSRRCLSNLCFRFSDERVKQKRETNKKGVVGSSGKKTPASPKATHTIPTKL